MAYPASPATTWRVAVLTLFGLSALAGCRPPADSSTSSQTQHAATPATTAASAAEVPASSAPATTPATTPAIPVNDPNGCMTSGCHLDLAQVAYRHAPLQAGACDACHGPEQPEHRFTLRQDGVALCTFCHPVVGHKEHLHTAIARTGCLPCHDPHGSNTKFLLTAPSVELTCRLCHDIERKSRLHGPFAGGQCTACHQPHESDNASLLIGGGGAQHCFVCHREKQEELAGHEEDLHEPVREGCVSCHDPHSSNNAYELTAPLEELCLRCHTDVADELAAAETPHGAVFTGDRCANCHDPHAAPSQFLLRDTLQNLCLTCHDRPVLATDGRTIPDMRPQLLERKYPHGPVQQGNCGACHAVHGARYARLLRQAFPKRFYAPFDLADYALCFQCHSPGIVLDEDTTTLTGFRNGSQNLHYVHVNRPEKGRTCRTCHEIHGSNLPRHIASTVPFEGGTWSMPIGFELTVDGGRCSPGCHEPREYRRSQPVPADSSGDRR